MSADAWPEGYARFVLDAVDSTNAHAARIAESLAGPTWILAHRQTAGRGRRGRPWAMPEGNFAATLVLQPQEPPDRAALRSFVAALALHDALVAVTGDPAPFALKWPNDVLLGGGKVAGILLESVGGGGRVRHLAIGFGVNLADAPAADAVEPGATLPVSLRRETGVEVAPEPFLERLAAAYARREAAFGSYGFGPVRDAWLARAARIGDRITARAGPVTHVGTFETLDETGALVLRTGEGRRSIPAADVYF